MEKSLSNVLKQKKEDRDREEREKLEAAKPAVMPKTGDFVDCHGARRQADARAPDDPYRRSRPQSRGR